MKTIIKYLPLLLVFTLGACSDNEPDEITSGNSSGTIEITGSNLNFTANRQEGYIRYETLDPVTVEVVLSSGEGNWCSANKTTEGNIVVSVAPNPRISSRSALVSLTSATGLAYVSVIQSGDRLVLEEFEIELDREGTERPLAVNSSSPFRVEYSEEWLDHRIEDGIVYFSSEWNSEWDRESYVKVVTETGLEETVLVWQHGKAMYNNQFMRSNRWYFNENRMSATIKQGFDGIHSAAKDITLYIGDDATRGQGVYSLLLWGNNYSTGYNFSYEPVDGTTDELLITQHYRFGNDDTSRGPFADLFWFMNNTYRIFIAFLPLLTEDQGDGVLSKIWRLEVLDEENPIDMKFVDPNDNDIWFVLSTSAHVMRPQ